MSKAGVLTVSKSDDSKPNVKVQADGWAIVTYVRQSGPNVGKEYWIYKSPSGHVCRTMKAALAAGFKPLVS